jgi:23S rRNA (uridine2552-2'-O)-methyltransferase
LTKRWLRDHKHDPYYKRAKAQGYRSRASYKLMQISQRFEIIRVGDSIIDLGCAPGGWLQVAVQLSFPGGTVIGVDLDKVKPMDGTIIFRGDMRDKEVAQKVFDALPRGRADVVLSDMSPNISGNYNIDHAKSIELSELAFDFACKVLRRGGRFVAKVFVGDMYRDYLKEVSRAFDSCRAHHPKASRSTSSETYVIGKGFRPDKIGGYERKSSDEE